ncbi:MAG: TonB-dependent receptor [Pseudomonadota bacterium]
MKSHKNTFSPSRITIAASLFSSVAAAAVATGAAHADEIIVTSQRQAQSLSDVPIAVTAISADSIADKQIEGFQDLQLNTPNLSFTKTQFTNSIPSIRGIAQLAIASTTTSSISIHQNDIPTIDTRLFETEFYDIERIEVLRGPQGTLFGRNATGGVINVHTAKPSTDEVSASGEFSYGNYDAVQVKAHLNVPLGETLAARVAGNFINRSGYTENIATGNDIDDREIFSVRGSLRWYPTDDTTIDLTASYFEEDDRRTSFQKTRCNSHPVLGCATGLIGTPGFEELGFDQAALSGTISSAGSQEGLATIGAGIDAQTGGFASPNTATRLGAFGLFSVADPDLSLVQGLSQPTNIRQVAQDRDPEYYADELFIGLNILHDFDNFSVKLNAGYGDTTVDSIRDSDGGVGPDFTIPSFTIVPLGLDYGGLNAFYAGGLPVSDVDSIGGIISGDVETVVPNNYSVEQSAGGSDYITAEAIVSSNLDGKFNFLVGGNYLLNESEQGADFNVAFNVVDYVAAVGGTVITDVFSELALIPPVDDSTLVAAFYAPTFLNDSIDSKLESVSVFGEVYYDITDTVKFSGGVRYNRDEISTFAGQPFVASFQNFAETIAQMLPFAVPIGTPNEAIADLIDSDPTTVGTTPAVSDYAFTDLTFDALTGRAVLQWEFEPGQNLYASWSRGFKPGGVNPENTGGLSFAPTFEDEVINAYEIGAKVSLLDGQVTANLAGFYYDYTDLQLVNVLGLATVNENTDATVWGLEGEFDYEPTDDLRFNLTAAYLNTEIKDLTSIDPANPAAGNPEAEVFSDLIFGTNCVVDNNGLPSLLGTAVPGLGPLTPFVPQCGLLEDIVALANTNPMLPAGVQYEYSNVGLAQSLDGNSLPLSPEWQFSVGVEYDFRFGPDLIFTPRADYYRQGDFYATQFNRNADLIDSYGNLNFQATLRPEDGNWYMRFFMQNALNDDNVVGQYVGPQSQGSFVNQFIQEPRRFGGAVGFVY